MLYRPHPVSLLKSGNPNSSQFFLEVSSLCFLRVNIPTLFVSPTSDAIPYGTKTYAFCIVEYRNAGVVFFSTFIKEGDKKHIDASVKERSQPLLVPSEEICKRILCNKHI